MLCIDKNKISLTRGDSAVFNVDLINEHGQVHHLSEGDLLIFTLKKSTRTKEIILQKHIERNEFKLSPDDTHELNFGYYVYDIQLIKVNGDIQTIVPPTSFEILQEVNYK